MSKIHDVNSPENLLFTLCKHVLNKAKRNLPDEVLTGQYQYAARLIGSRFTSPISTDPFHLAEKIKRSLAKQGREADAVLFSELHSKIQAQSMLQHQGSMLYLLQTLAKNTKSKEQPTYFGGALDSLSVTQYSNKQHSNNKTSSSRSSSGIGSSYGESFSFSSLQTKNEASDFGIQLRSRNTASNDKDTASIAAMVSHSLVLNKNPRGSNSSEPIYEEDQDIIPFKSEETNTMLSKCFATGPEGAVFEITEKLLIRDVLFVFQGIEGRLIKYDAGMDAYRIGSDVGVPLSVRDLISKLAELGWLFRRVRKFLDARSGDKALGLVGQSFCAAVQKELTEYYRLVAVLEAQENQEDDGIVHEGGGLTLRRLMIWTYDPLQRMKALATLVDVCKGKKGGSLLSAIFSHTQTGDPFICKLVKHILHVVSHPIRSILERWIFDGELQDNFNEFFIASDPAVRNERLWHEKYSLRKQMLPSFIHNDLATKILNIGKSINFIRVVCDDRSPIFGHSAIKNNNEKSVKEEKLAVEELNSSALKIFIDLVYENTSKHLLDVLFRKYKFLDHLKAMRRYLLLGQGDFIRHLMDLLEPDLVRPANSLYMHNLTGLLEAAIRATNAQFDDADILKRLDCRLLEISPGDCGWDVFSLDYHVDGPISTIFTQDTILNYLRIFNFLWRAKRMEYCLTGIWKNQMSSSRLLIKLPEVAPLLHISHCLEAEMVHFIHQMQYFISYEVLECCWEELLVMIEQAKDLDDVISAHETFLNKVMTRALMDNESRAMLTQLRAIFDLIIQFQTTQENMYAAAICELEARQALEKKADQKTSEGDWGLTEEDSMADIKRTADFMKTFLPSTRAQLRVLHQSYQDMLQQFLVMLNSHSDVSLRFLCFRLDFNEHYKKLEPKLRSPMKYSRYKRTPSSAADTKM